MRKIILSILMVVVMMVMMVVPAFAGSWTKTITASAGVGGLINPVGEVEVDYWDDQKFVITANAGYYISGLLIDGTQLSPFGVYMAYTYTFHHVTSDHTISATFDSLVGAQGPAGEDGMDGVNGTDGDIGPQGEQGMQGYTGYVIIEGAVGPQGEVGPAGEDGIDGIDGIDGVDGKDGIDGVDGVNGADGVNGVDGKDGLDGIDGKDGRDGIDGKDGKDGVDGSVGETGLPGYPDSLWKILVLCGAVTALVLGVLAAAFSIKANKGTLQVKRT